VGIKRYFFISTKGDGKKAPRWHVNPTAHRSTACSIRERGDALPSLSLLQRENNMIAAFLLLAHSWYPSECCEDRHCYPVEWMAETKDDILVKTEDGVQVSVPKSFPTRSSLDGEYHLCFQKEALRLYGSLEIYCFFVPGLS